MQINVQKYLDQAAADEVQHFETSVKPEQVKNAAEIKAALQPVVDAVIDALKRNQLMRATLVVEGTVPTTISLETGIINMPLANAKKVANFFEVEEIVPVNVYLVTDNPFLNASGLRIDLLADSDTFASATGKLLDNIAPHVLEQLQHIDEEAAKPAPDPAEKAVKKPAAKKTTRKTTRKVATKTTRKTAAKKPAANKAAAKTTRTKKAAD
ncbi:hypothetical protein [Lacticaseibacillus hulanensis]|uniref:hypothetical protein n=1 Tax=Lacticaseibacillus hulanensis TaxID=2493111 RepID=UPI000FDB14C2|nr:hypothetical protein [Lacticaseibacillus hulanensis]